LCAHYASFSRTGGAISPRSLNVAAGGVVRPGAELVMDQARTLYRLWPQVFGSELPI
jgi:hypothetical protein